MHKHPYSNTYEEGLALAVVDNSGVVGDGLAAVVDDALGELIELVDDKLHVAARGRQVVEDGVGLEPREREAPSAVLGGESEGVCEKVALALSLCVQLHTQGRLHDNVESTFVGDVVEVPANVTMRDLANTLRHDARLLVHDLGVALECIKVEGRREGMAVHLPLVSVRCEKALAKDAAENKVVNAVGLFARTDDFLDHLGIAHLKQREATQHDRVVASLLAVLVEQRWQPFLVRGPVDKLAVGLDEQ